MDTITIGLIAVVFISFIPLSCFGEEPPPSGQVEALVRQFVLSSAPKRDRPLELEVTNFDVKRLWEEMKLQVFDVQYGHKSPGHRDRQHSGDGFIALYHRGRIVSLSSLFGGLGLMSGVVCKSVFYFTYSWGSGIHRYHVGMLEIVNGELVRRDSGGFEANDLIDVFVAGDSHDNVALYSGQFKRFNEWSDAKSFGTIQTQGANRLGIIGNDGQQILPDFPVAPRELWIAPADTIK
jgi:hypothetical protein